MGNLLLLKQFHKNFRSENRSCEKLSNSLEMQNYDFIRREGLKTLGRRCINVIQIVCVNWESIFNRFCTDFTLFTNGSTLSSLQSF